MPKSTIRIFFAVTSDGGRKVSLLLIAIEKREVSITVIKMVNDQPQPGDINQEIVLMGNLLAISSDEELVLIKTMESRDHVDPDRVPTKQITFQSCPVIALFQHIGPANQCYKQTVNKTTDEIDWSNQTIATLLEIGSQNPYIILSDKMKNKIPKIAVVTN